MSQCKTTFDSTLELGNSPILLFLVLVLYHYELQMKKTHSDARLYNQKKL